MDSKTAIERFGDTVRIPKPQIGGLLLSGDGVFSTLQGEGITAGCPAIFIRLHRCNLECSWKKAGGEICDAWYTWKTDSREYWTEHEFVLFEELFRRISRYPCRRIVFTGGEPLMQQQQILGFFDSLSEEWDIEIETNGTIMPLEELFVYQVQINCSPKLASSGNPLHLRIVPDVLIRFDQYSNTTFKFVAVDEKDLTEIENLVSSLDLDQSKIMIMCEGTSSEVLTKRMQSLAELVKNRGWRMTPRLQCYIWGNTRAT